MLSGKVINKLNVISMKDYLSPEIEVLALVVEQAVMASSTTKDGIREDYDSFDLFE